MASRYVALSPIAHPRYNCAEGKTLVNCPPDLLAQFIKAECVKLIGEDGPPTNVIVDQDVLTPLNQRDLVNVIIWNDLRGMVNPKTNWSDEQIRQAIRDVWPDLSTLKLEQPKPLIDETDSGNSGATVVTS